VRTGSDGRTPGGDSGVCPRDPVKEPEADSSSVLGRAGPSPGGGSSGNGDLYAKLDRSSSILDISSGAMALSQAACTSPPQMMDVQWRRIERLYYSGHEQRFW
jgi:hypothetical protein